MYVYFNLPANEIICNGKQITFQAPYDCSSIDKIILIASNGTSETERKNFVLCDSLGNSLVGKTGYFTANSYVSVLLDKDNGKAYLQTFAKSIQDSTSAGALSNSRTGLCTERDIYYGLPTINGKHTYTSSNNIYAPTSVGTSGYILRSNGSGAPSWISTLGGNGLLFTAIQTVSVNIAQYGFLDTTLTPTQYGGFTPIMATLAYPANDDMYCNKCFLSGNTIYLGIKAPHSSCNGTVGIFVLYVRT